MKASLLQFGFLAAELYDAVAYADWDIYQRDGLPTGDVSDQLERLKSIMEANQVTLQEQPIMRSENFEPNSFLYHAKDVSSEFLQQILDSPIISKVEIRPASKPMMASRTGARAVTEFYGDCDAQEQCQAYLHGDSLRRGKYQIDGINYWEAQKKYPYTGTDVQLVFWETGYYDENHSYLPSYTKKMIASYLSPVATQTAGIPLGQGVSNGIRGIAPDVMTVFGPALLASSIDGVIDCLDEGDVVYIGSNFVLNSQLVGQIATQDPACYAYSCQLPGYESAEYRDLFRRLNERGIIVVANAGDGNVNFNTQYMKNHIPTDQLYESILVAAVDSSTNTRLAASNYGDAFEFYSWGNNVTTTAAGDSFTHINQGTTSAAAIVLGAVLNIQSGARFMLGRPLLPAELKSLLKDTGKRYQGPSTEIATLVQPDLKAAYDELCIRYASEILDPAYC